ncbi:MAG: DUF192 domain-containing protein [Candidatus Anstonellaceae archaeon]
MKLSNISKKKSLRADVEIADSELSRMRGLMFRKKVIPMLFIFDSEGIFPIHSYFVKGKFDAVYLSVDKAVTEIFRGIPPGTPLVTPKKKAKYLLELPSEMTRKLAIEEEDKMNWNSAK